MHERFLAAMWICARRAVYAALTLILALTFCLSPVSLLAQTSTSTTRVALLADKGCTDEKSREAIFRILSNAPGIRIDKVSTPTISAESFGKDYDVLILPGGTGGGEAKAVGLEGGRRLTEFVKNGKGIVAICAGGYYVAEGWSEVTRAVELVNAKNFDGEHWARGEGYIAVKALGTSDANSSRTMWFENGPIFVPATIPGLPGYASLVKYVTDMAARGAPTGMMEGRDAVIAAPFGKGRVVAFGPHPELSPSVNHWLVNAVKWAAAGDDGTSPTVAAVLEASAPRH
ncbi:MAG: BPL-N domain-containing protein [Candidatus Sumerlaeaceae bacterium]